MKTNYLFVIFLITMPCLMDAQQEVDPPPAAPIDDYISLLALGAIVIAAYFFYAKKLKTQLK